MKSQGILSQVRAEGRQEGYSQAAMCSYDDAWERGYRNAEKDAPSRFRWFAFGAIVAFGLVALFSYYQG